MVLFSPFEDTYCMANERSFMVKVGDKIRIICMNGEPQYTGKTGTVEYIDDIGQVHGSWGGCALIPNVDKYEIIEER